MRSAENLFLYINQQGCRSLISVLRLSMLILSCGMGYSAFAASDCHSRPAFMLSQHLVPMSRRQQCSVQPVYCSSGSGEQRPKKGIMDHFMDFLSPREEVSKAQKELERRRQARNVASMAGTREAKNVSVSVNASRYIPPELSPSGRKKSERGGWEERVQFDAQRHGNRMIQDQVWGTCMYHHVYVCVFG